ncbi:4-hydroxythreonine-4-phosphate dehydrogenase PdxA [Parapedomonas caeni]
MPLSTTAEPPRADPPLIVSIGDPAGVGPETIVQAWEQRHAIGLPPFAVAGDAAALRAVWAGPVATISDLDDAARHYRHALPVLDVGSMGDSRPGRPTADGARLAFAALEAGVDLTVGGGASALVTGPVNKAALAAIGYRWPGQTEFVAERAGVSPEDAVMMLAGPSVRTVPVTIHVPLREVPARLTTALIVQRGRVTAEALRRDLGLRDPRLAVTGLNPHAGERGRLGDEEETVVRPAVEQLRAMGIDATGPLPADSLFAPHIRGRYDAMVCMYHDQALIPIKALDFDSGVNMTLGLPIVRTSPDHGTAFDIAGRGEARPDAMIAAIRMAALCAAHRRRPS